MNKKIVLIIALLVVGVGFLSGCNEEEVEEVEEGVEEGVEGGVDEVELEVDIEENIKGQWSAPQSESTYGFTFYNDGTCKLSFGAYIMGKYYIVGDKLEFHHEKQEYTPAFINYYDIEMPDKDTLILTARSYNKLSHDGRLEFTRLN